MVAAETAATTATRCHSAQKNAVHAQSSTTTAVQNHREEIASPQNDEGIDFLSWSGLFLVPAVCAVVQGHAWYMWYMDRNAV